MMSVMCPACDERIAGASYIELSENVRSHFEDVHDLERSPMSPGVERPEYREGREVAPPSAYELSEGAEGRSVGAEEVTEREALESREGHLNEGEEAMFPQGPREPPREPRRSPSRPPLRPTIEGSQGPGRETSGVAEQMGSGLEETMRIAFQCPVCGEDIEGASEEEASSAFRGHLLSVHRDEPFVTALMERVGSR